MKVGDKVKFLNDIGGGTITKLVDKRTALVLNQDEFEVPVLLAELIPDESENDFFSVGTRSEPETKTVEVVKEIDFFEEDDNYSERATNEIELIFAIIPTNFHNLQKSDFDLYLINDCNWNLMYVYQTVTGNFYKSYPGKMSPNTKEYLKTISKKELEKFKQINFQGIVYQKDSHEFKAPIQKLININIPNFFKQKHYKGNDFFKEKAFIIQIYQENLMAEAVEKLTKSKMHQVVKDKSKSKKINKPKQFQKQERNKIVEIDLHIHELIDDETGMTPKDKLDLQMKTFKDELHKAMKDSAVKKIVFIHGKGEGVLKNELRKELKISYKQLNFQDASFQKYGFGATLVHV